MHKQGLDGHPQKNLGILISESGSPKKWFAIAHENHRNGGIVRFGARLTLKMGRNGRNDKLAAEPRS